MKKINPIVTFSTLFIFFCLQGKTVAGPATELKVLHELARPSIINVSDYGSGPLIEPGQTYYLSVNGSDTGNGLAWDTAWKTLGHAVKKLQPGDTLLIGEGEYEEPGLLIDCSGEPGRPVTIAAAPGNRVLFRSAVTPAPLRKTPGRKNVYEVGHELPKLMRLLVPSSSDPFLHSAGVWEEPAVIKLEPAGNLSRLDELPGTFHYDETEKKLYVHFSDSKGPESNSLAVTVLPVVGRYDVYSQGRAGVELTGSYVNIRGINFRFGFAGLAVFDGHNNTVENCSFFATDLAGLVLWRDAKRNLVRNNYFVRNGLRGSVLVYMGGPQTVRETASDNLFKNNLMEPSRPTLRSGGTPVYVSMGIYGWPGPRNHVINNIFDDPDRSSFLGRGASPESVLQGNVLTGNLRLLDWYRQYPEDGSERILVRNNTVLGNISAPGFSACPEGKIVNRAGKGFAFFNNIELKHDSRDVESAGFADPSYHDYRLLPDSPFAGKGFAGQGIGAYPESEGNIFYVSPAGNDANEGKSAGSPLKTLSAASGKLADGDTLYLMEGRYPGRLVIDVSGTGQNPVIVRAYGRKQVFIEQAVIKGDHVEVRGLSFKNTGSDAVTVTGDNVILKRCFFLNGAGAAIRAESAENLEVRHCTFVRNSTGIILGHGSTGVSVRDNLFAGNDGLPVEVSECSAEGYMASHNAYHVDGLPPVGMEEWGSVKGDMKFVGANEGDYRVWNDSPAAHAGIYAGTFGSFAAVARPPVIFEVRAVNVRDASAVITWETPGNDTSGKVYYRLSGSSDWAFASAPGQGTVHAAGLSRLSPGTDYEFKVEASGRRGGSSTSGVHYFTTASLPNAPTVFYLSDSGDDGSDGLSEETAWRTIRKANTMVGPGDTLLVAPGEYSGPVSPFTGGTSGQKRVIYRAHGEGAVIIDGYNAVAPLVSLSSKNYVTVDGFIFVNPLDSVDDIIRISGSRGFELLNSRISRDERIVSTFTKAMIVFNSPGMRIENNVFWGTRYHLVVYGASGLSIKNNTFARGDVTSILIHGRLDERGYLVKEDPAEVQETVVVNNIFYHPVTPPNNPGLWFRIARENVKSDHNLFCLFTTSEGDVRGHIARIDVSGETVAEGATIQQWRENTGMDENSVYADPLFAGPDKGDFRLLPESPAIGVGLGGKNIGASGRPVNIR